MNHLNKIRPSVIFDFSCLLQTHFKKTIDLKEIFFHGLIFQLSLLLEMHTSHNFLLYSVKIGLAEGTISALRFFSPGVVARSCR